MEIGVAEPISKQKQRLKYLRDNGIHTLYIVVSLLLYGALAIFLPVCNEKDTESDS